MPEDILKLITEGATKEVIKAEIAKGSPRVPLFELMPEIGGRSLFEQLRIYKKYRNWTLEDFLEGDAIDLNELDVNHHRLMFLFIENGDEDSVKALLRNGDSVHEDEYHLAEAKSNIFDLLNYRPGKHKPSIYEFTNRHHGHGYLQKIKMLLLDEAETTDNESSDEDFERFDIPDPPDSCYNELTANTLVDNFNHTGQSEHLAVVEYRGFHRGKKCSHDAWHTIKTEAFHPEATYSLAAVDPNFEQNGDANAAGKAIVLKAKCQETEQAEDDSRKSTAGRCFDNLFLRMLQEYIMAFSRLVIRGEIQTAYLFPSRQNPFLSTTCNAGKAALYASGVRHSKITQIWRDPHYRRFTAAPKHPVMGYVDVYVFDINYVRNNSYCRDRLLAQKKISLSKMYMNDEGERIFIAEIPQQFHNRRFFIVFPDCYVDLDQTAKGKKKTPYQLWKQKYHLDIHKSTLECVQKKITTFDRRNTADGKTTYLTALSTLTERIDTYIGYRMENLMRHTLFAEKQTVVVRDDQLSEAGVDQIRLKM